MPRYCPSCGGQLDLNASTCPTCGKPAAVTTGLVTSAPGGLTDNMAGMLAYFTFIPALIFLLVEPYNKQRFIRFHAFQSLFFHIAWTVLWVALRVVASIPVLGWTTVLLWPLVGLGGFILWLVLVMKAYGGQMFKLPVIGEIAAQQVGMSTTTHAEPSEHRQDRAA